MIANKQIADKVAFETNSGYWSVSDQFFFDKSECLKYASSIKNTHVTFHFFDQFYNSLNWIDEPLEGIEKLYSRRAKQLREKYDYIVVAYSGGADSSTVIDSFVENGLHLDEIITSYPLVAIEKLKNSFNPLDKSPKNLMFEYSEAVVPKLDYVRANFSRTKITVLDHTDAAIKLISTNKLHMLPVAGFGAAPSLAGHHLIGKRLREVSEQYKNVCFLIGIDKPRIGYNLNHKRFGVFFDDVSTCWGHYTDESLSGFQPTTEYFYYALDMPAIIIKQTHAIINKIKPIIDENQNYQIHDLHDLYYKRGDNLVLKVHHDFFKKILYPSWSTDIFQAKKPTSFFFQESAYWFTNTNITDKRTKDYHYGQVVESCDGMLEQFVVRGISGFPSKFVDMTTKPIPICL